MNLNCVRRDLVLSLVVFSILVTTTLPGVTAEGLTPEQVVNLQQVSSVALDPSGKRVAYTLVVPRSSEDERGPAYSELWVISASGGEAVQYTAKPTRVSAVAWSPDGEYLTFISKRELYHPKSQIYRMRANGGEAMPLTRHDSAVLMYRWSPDGKHIAFVASDPESEEEKKAKKAGEDWKVYDENYKHRRLWLLDVSNGESRQLLTADLSVWSLVWAPDSKTVFFQATTTPLIDDSYMFKKIYRVSLDGGTPEVVCETSGKLGGMAVSPDGKQLAFLGAVSQNDPLAQSVFVVPAQGGSARNLTENAEFSANTVAWLDNHTLLMLATEGTHSSLSRLDTRSGERKVVINGGPILQSVSLHRKSGSFAAVAHSPSHPREVYFGAVDKKSARRLTHHNPELENTQLARQEVVEWQGADGWRIEGVLTYPLGYEAGQRYPLVLQIHGGPEGVSLNGWTTTATYPVQVLASHGYMVLQPNYRGSGGRGVAFSKADHDDLGGKEFEDVLAGVDALIERGLVDGNRVGTGGWSYGGYFSAWAATKHSQRFKASVVAAGLSNWISFAGTTDIPHEMSLVHWNSYWYDQPDLHWERSPVRHINNAHTATLVVHGTADARVHPEQSIQLYTHLKLKKVPSQLVLYPRQPHGLVERAHQLDFIKRVLGWFDKYIQTPGTF